jgi:ubiquinone/menaquinone biosynthesis C-methylase UbiE
MSLRRISKAVPPHTAGPSQELQQLTPDTDGAEPAAGDVAGYKSCCAAAYEGEAVRLVLGDSWHPGGVRLTEEMAQRAGISAAHRVLDAACGRGASALALAQRYGCPVVGVDLSGKALSEARRAAAGSGLAGLVTFKTADAEALPFPPASFDLALCECALCTFPSKAAAAGELARVLRPGGCAAVADVLLTPGPLPPDLNSALGRALCVAEALPLAGYAALLQAAGLEIAAFQECRREAADFLRQIDRRLLLLRVGQAVGKLVPPDLDVREARRLLAQARGMVAEGRLSYGYVIARKPSDGPVAAECT